MVSDGGDRQVIDQPELIPMPHSSKSMVSSLEIVWAVFKTP
jgi:hypothetical protein